MFIVDILKEFFLNILFGYMSIGFFYLFIQSLYKINSSQKWPITEGTIIYSSIEYAYEHRDGGYLPINHYIYEVNGLKYINDKISWGISIKMPYPKDSLNNNHKLLKLGKKVKVYYNPKKPKESVLIIKFQYSIILFLIVSAVCGIITIVL